MCLQRGGRFREPLYYVLRCTAHPHAAHFASLGLAARDEQCVLQFPRSLHDTSEIQVSQRSSGISLAT